MLDALGLEWTADGDVCRKSEKPRVLEITGLPSPTRSVIQHKALLVDEESIPRPVTDRVATSSPSTPVQQKAASNSDPPLTASARAPSSPPIKVKSAPILHDEDEYIDKPVAPTSPQRSKPMPKLNSKVDLPNRSDTFKKKNANVDVLSEDQQREWQHCIKVFGQDEVVNFLSKESTNREQGVKAMTQKVMNGISKESPRGDDGPEALIRGGHQAVVKAFTYTSEKNLCLAMEFERALQRESS